MTGVDITQGCTNSITAIALYLAPFPKWGLREDRQHDLKSLLIYYLLPATGLVQCKQISRFYESASLVRTVSKIDYLRNPMTNDEAKKDLQPPLMLLTNDATCPWLISSAAEDSVIVTPLNLRHCSAR
ncbi:hypothetical protein J6590_006746 [Homalodisca vitripennis]|nr:hypothetical protein J6590_006746 [Homalodisca vitripennis]